MPALFAASLSPADDRRQPVQRRPELADSRGELGEHGGDLVAHRCETAPRSRPQRPVKDCTSNTARRRAVWTRGEIIMVKKVLAQCWPGNGGDARAVGRPQALNRTRTRTHQGTLRTPVPTWV